MNDASSSIAHQRATEGARNDEHENSSGAAGAAALAVPRLLSNPNNAPSTDWSNNARGEPSSFNNNRDQNFVASSLAGQGETSRQEQHSLNVNQEHSANRGYNNGSNNNSNIHNISRSNGQSLNYIPNAKTNLFYTDEYDSPLRENVKIVVVGDSGCGKSKLVYAQACRRTFSDKELNSCYVPTIWAIDQYKYRRDVQELANTCIDGAHVQVRIWDTFGDHFKDRYFAYQNADVVVLCFSLCDRTSLKNAQGRWLKEIHHYLKNMPIILAGTMLDMRWKDLKMYNKTRNKFNRKISPSDIVSPDEAREACENVGLPYYESTVLTGYGVSDVFENAVRAALVYRRTARMYTMNHLRKVREPQLQPPCLPPEPSYPQLPPIVQSTYVSDIKSLHSAEESADVILCCGSSKFFCHKLLLVQCSGLFSVFFEHQCALQSLLGGDCSDTGGDSDLDSEHNGENRYSLSEIGGLKQTDFFLHGLPILKLLFHNYILEGPPCSSGPQRRIASSQEDSMGQSESSSSFAQQVAIHTDIPRTHVATILYFVYHLSLPSRLNCSLYDLTYTAKLFKIPDLVLLLRSQGAVVGSDCRPHHQSQLSGVHSKLLSVHNRACSSNSSLNSCSSSSENNLSNLYSGMSHLTVSGSSSNNNNSKQLESEIEHNLVLKRQEFFKREFLKQQPDLSGNFTFHVQNETIWVHKYLLGARSKYMSSLLSGSFREGQGRDLLFVDISPEAMRVVLCYLYTDQLIWDKENGSMQCLDWSEAIELANRLCLDRLISLIEHEVVDRLRREKHSDGVKESLLLVDKCNLYNAHGLHQWTFTHLCHNYDFMCKNFTYLKQTMLCDGTKEELLNNRWPPVWYIKEKDYYERRSRLLTKVEADKRQMRNGMSRWWLWRKQNFL